jgi:hypothetical protein
MKGVLRFVRGLGLSAQARIFALLAFMTTVLAMSGVSFALDGDITQADFTGVATKVLAYLGYAIGAGLTVLVAVVAAQAGWKFFTKFIK